jgi:hypothetical protein
VVVGIIGICPGCLLGGDEDDDDSRPSCPTALDRPQEYATPSAVIPMECRVPVATDKEKAGCLVEGELQSLSFFWVEDMLYQLLLGVFITVVYK